VTTLKTIDEEKKIEIQLLKKSKKSITNKTLKAIEEGKKAEDILYEREKMVASKK
jgi:hypothetical protein